ncbi:MAG: RcnB family protein [Pseudomonas sp.]|uniref:RcnB family protein n=1 Tax=Pseudomonas abieticivorans TaxID=2931382 RepID=UPI0020BFB891|nr:RcnB family protein [Pseudomonas sp. PIA16]MDE1167771.1 RcnB family protein [Pseudomonas sp.]
MKKIIAACCASLMLLAPLASYAQPGPGDGGQNRPPGQQGGPQGGPQNNGGHQQQGRPPQNGGHQQQRPPQQNGGHQQQRPPQQYRPNPQYNRPGDHGPQAGMPRPHSEWHRGGYAPPMYRNDRYWVTDWQARRLPPPPREHRWLRVNGDYVLVAITTGVIVNILSGY